ncbi:hypothetical protein B7486_46880 [cyanobacterium TDX16]|nr:hypothetical protein B7486_46880 [cyanobacterium TDX16]
MGALRNLSDPTVIQLFRNIGKTPRMNSSEALEAAQKLQACRGKSRHTRENRNITSSTEEETQEARQRLFEGNLRLVVHTALKYVKDGVELLDLIQDGCFGLERAIEKYNPKLGYAFSTYAVWWIRQAIYDSIRRQSRTIGLPSKVWGKLSKVSRAESYYIERYGVIPSLAEVATRADLEPDVVSWIRERIPREVSLEDKVFEQGNLRFTDVVAWDGVSPEEYAEIEEASDRYEQLLNRLTPREKEVVRLRIEEVKLSDIAVKMGISTSRILQLETKALNRLRNAIALPNEQRKKNKQKRKW